MWWLRNLGLVGLGVWLGLLGISMHRSILAMLALTLGVALLLSWVIAPGIGRISLAVGWVAVVGFAVFPRPEGDLVLVYDVPGITLLGLTVLLTGWVLVTAALPKMSR
jgi:hypothetical protein